MVANSIKTLEFKLTLNATQAASIDSWLDVQRWVWNRGLGLLKEFETFSHYNKHDEAYAPCCPVPWEYRWVPNDGKNEWRDAAIVRSYEHKWRPIPLPLITESFPGQWAVRPAQCPLLQHLFEADNPRPGKVSLTLKVDRGEIIRTWPSIQLYRKPRLLEILEAKPMTTGGVIRKGKVTEPRKRDWSHAISEAMQHSSNPKLTESFVSAKITQTTVKKLSEAWKKYFYRKKDALGRLAGCPQFKPMKGKCQIKTISDENPQSLFKTGTFITLPGTNKTLGKLNVKGLDRRWPDSVAIKTYRIMREPSGYYLLLVGELPCAAPKPSTKVAGFDAGVVHILNDDAGHHIDIPSPLKRRLQKIKRLSRKAARQEKGSANQKKTYALLALEHEKVKRDRKAWHHKLSTFAVRKYGAIAVEDLKLANMTRKPKAKPNAEGTGYDRNMAAAKAGLNRSLLDAGFGQLYDMMEAKSKAFGREFAKVPPQFTSQTCNECGEVNKASRLTQAEFVCVGCGHTANADTNAAKNIRDIAFPDKETTWLRAGEVTPGELASRPTMNQEEAQASPQGDALAISPKGALPKQRDLPDVINFQPLKPSKLVRQKRPKNRSAQVAPETPVQLSVWEVAAETG